MAYLCETCRDLLEPDDQVVAAAELSEVTSQESGSREFVEGVRSLWHVRHWREQPGYRKVAEGSLRELV